MKGARPGDTLAIEVLELRPRNWGWTAELVDAPNWVVGCFLPDTIFS